MQFEEYYLASVFWLVLPAGGIIFMISSFYVARLRRAAGRRMLKIWRAN